MRQICKAAGLMMAAMLLSSCINDENFNKTPELSRSDSWEAFQVRHEEDITATQAAKPELPENPTLQQCQTYAALNNPELQAAFYGWQAAVEEIPQAKALPNPELTAKYYFSSIETSLGQTFPAWEKIQARTDAAASNAKTKWQELQAKKFAVYASVQKAWADLYYAQKAADITRDKLALLEQMEQVLNVRYRTSEVTQADLLRLQVDKEEIRNRLISFEKYLEPMQAALNIQLGRQARSPIRIADFPDMTIVDVDREKAILTIMQKNPSLLASKQDIATAQDLVRLAKAEYIPDLTVEIGWMVATKKMGSPDDGDDPVMGSVGLSLPIWHEAIQAKIRQSRHAQSMAMMQYNAMSLDIQSSLEDAFFRHEDSQRRTMLYTDVLLPKAKESWKVTQRRYVNQLASYNDMIDTLQTLLEFELSLQQARAECLAARGRLQELTTAPVEEMAMAKQTPKTAVIQKIKGKDNDKK